jgi:hypothetical protein
MGPTESDQWEASPGAWPELPLDEWSDTHATLHRWLQIVGKIRLVRSPLWNHWWQVTLYLTPRGLTTSPIPYDRGVFAIDFDFIDHQLIIETSRGEVRTTALAPRSVADFYRDLMALLRELGAETRIDTLPVEIPDPLPFEEDHEHASYDPRAVERCHTLFLQADRLLKEFRARFLGKCSPVHFFWGSFDLAMTRFSGRRAPEHPGGIPHTPDFVTREAYSHEVASWGFWPGSGPVPEPAFYAYAYPEPPGFKTAAARPECASYHPDLSEFVLTLGDARRLDHPERAILEFFQSTYDAAADLGRWDRAALDRTSAELRALAARIGIRKAPSETDDPTAGATPGGHGPT